MPTPVSPEPVRSAPSVRRAPAAAAPAGTADPGLKASCDGMEALFIQHMLTEMRKTVPRSGLLDGGRAEEIYTAMMDGELAGQMAASGGLGLSSVLYEQLSRSAVTDPSKPPRP